MKQQPYLSVVVATRDDDHGGNPFARLAKCIEIYNSQCSKLNFPIEYIIVDWNSPKNKGIASKIKKEKVNHHNLRLKVIEVPQKIHQHLNDAKINFYQMIAKNVGIRRAKGDFILASNIDIFLSDNLMEMISKKNLNKKRMYRCDRYDLKSSFLQSVYDPFELEKYFTRINYRNMTLRLDSTFDYTFFKQITRLSNKFNSNVSWPAIIKERLRIIKKAIGISGSRGFSLHTNACGDFTLLSRQAWMETRGYSEWKVFSWHLDSIFCLNAHEMGFHEKTFGSEYKHFHIDHTAGWTPESAQALFSRLKNNQIKYISDERVRLISEAIYSAKAKPMNEPTWGLAKINLKERTLSDPFH